MSGYVREFDAITKVDGEEVRVRLRPIKLADAINLQGLKPEQMTGEFQRALGNYIVEIRGLKAADGSEVTKDEFLESAYFLDALLDVGEQWIARATPKRPPSPSA